MPIWSSLKKCPKPSGQGSRPPPPYGQCPNAQDMNLSGASLSWLVRKSHFRISNLWLPLHFPLLLHYFCTTSQYPARVSFLENSREFFSNFTSRSRGIFISLFTLDLDFKAFWFHFSFLGKSESISNFTLFSREKRVKYAFLVMKNSKIMTIYISSWKISPISYNNDLLVGSRSVIVTRLWKQMNFTNSRFKDKLNVTEKLSLSLFLFISTTRQWSEQRCIQRFPTQSIHTALQVTCLNQGPSPKAFCCIPK